MKITNEPQEKYLNCVKVKGQLIGVFYSQEFYSVIGSKRSIVEQVFGIYSAESDIDIISKSESTIPTISKE